MDPLSFISFSDQTPPTTPPASPPPPASPKQIKRLHWGQSEAAAVSAAAISIPSSRLCMSLSGSSSTDGSYVRGLFAFSRPEYPSPQERMATIQKSCQERLDKILCGKTFDTFNYPLYTQRTVQLQSDIPRIQQLFNDVFNEWRSSNLGNILSNESRFEGFLGQWLKDLIVSQYRESSQNRAGPLAEVFAKAVFDEEVAEKMKASIDRPSRWQTAPKLSQITPIFRKFNEIAPLLNPRDMKDHPHFSMNEAVEECLCNRYPDIVPFDSNMIRLNCGQYINISPIVLDSKLSIISQSPLSDTTWAFIEILKELGIERIITLCVPIEGGKPKGYDFYSSRMKSEEVIAEEGSERIVRRLLVIQEANDEDPEILVTQLHYENWPDFGVPSRSLFEILLQLTDEPAVELVHCSAGAGRSGLERMARRFRTCTRNDTNIPLIEELVKGRFCRNGLVQTAEQMLAIIESIN